jgi:hypothetical protein
MKTLHELLNILVEAEVTTKTAEDLWSEGSPKTYISKIQYGIKKNDNGSYQVTTETNDRRKIINGSVTAAYVNSNFTKLSKDASPDVEGYVLYRSSGQQEAIQHKGETTKVDVGGTKVNISSGDYLVRSVDGDKASFSVETEDAFEADWETK